MKVSVSLLDFGTDDGGTKIHATTPAELRRPYQPTSGPNRPPLLTLMKTKTELTYFTTVTVPENVDNVQILVKRAIKKTICTLVKVTTRGENVSLDDFSALSNSEDFTLVPISRSFIGMWDKVAGPYSVKGTKKGKHFYKLKIPVDSSPVKPFKLFLIAYQRVPLPSQMDMRARFLEQATFGPTLESLNGWQFSKGREGFAQWIRSQVGMDMTSHRAYWRQHADWSMINEGPHYTTITPLHPCAQYSRWRDYAFTSHDANAVFVSIPITVGATTMTLLLVNGEPRTVVPFNSQDPDNIPWGSHSFCKSISLSTNIILQSQWVY